MIESHVTNLELSKRLKELGVKQDSLFFHCTFYNKSSTVPNEQLNVIIFHSDLEEELGKNYLEELKFYSAFLSSELGKMMPDAILDEYNGMCFIKNQKKDNEYKVYIDSLEKLLIFFSENEADARAKMLIHLIENNLVIDEWKKEWLA